MKRILIFGPIGDLGGRELEVAFIAKTLSTNYFVDICTSGSFTKSSQVFEFDKNQNFFGLNSLLYRKSRIFKTLSYLSYVKNKKKGAKYDYVNNAVLKKYFNYEREIEVVLESLVLNYDAVFICAQLCSTFVDKIIKFAKKHNRKILFRTTGFISSNDYNYINDVDCFIHHSFNNANRIENNKPHTYVIIDQCAFNEEHFFKKFQ
ncbi:hypothetical protein [Gelidibacter algens]|uniref:hypothetical protein n=1 Tax=Gelidibacter algens TaxID=49280 RepID=UPI0012FC7576|nr:hypothetical protein [Gelidibacter algens]